MWTQLYQKLILQHYPSTTDNKSKDKNQTFINSRTIITPILNLTGRESEMQFYFCVIWHSFVNKQCLPTTLIQSRTACWCLVKKRAEREEGEHKSGTCNSRHQRWVFLTWLLPWIVSKENRKEGNLIQIDSVGILLWKLCKYRRHDYQCHLVSCLTSKCIWFKAMI